MCDFFSFVSDGNGKFMYFDWELRRKCLSDELSYDPDSHTSIADYYGYIGEKEDILNKYEYNPLTDKFKIDQINTVRDSEPAKAFVEALDFKAIVPALIVKPIVNPFTIENEVEPRDVENLHKCASVRASVWASVGYSARASVGESVWESVWESVRASVWETVWESVWASDGASVWESVWESIRASDGESLWESVWESVGAYASTFFGIEYKHDFSPYINLWERGFVPVYDGKTGRLHGKSGVVYTDGGRK